MRWLTRSFVIAVVTALSFVLSLQSASAAIFYGFSVIGPVVDAEVGMVISQELTVGISPEELPRTFTAVFATASSTSGVTASYSVLSADAPAVVSLSLVLSAGDIAECTSTGSLVFFTTVFVEDPNGRDFPPANAFRSVPCSLPAPDLVIPLPPTQTSVCGPNNDVINQSPQPLGVDVLTDISWLGGFFTVQFFPLEG